MAIPLPSSYILLCTKIDDMLVFMRNVRTLLFPQPFLWVSTSLYLGVLFSYFYTQLRFCACELSISNSVGLVITILILFILDRYPYWRYGEIPIFGSVKSRPHQVAFAALILQFIAVEVVSQIEGFGFSSYLYLLIPFNGFYHFGSKVGAGLSILMWLVHFGKLWLLNSPFWYNDYHMVDAFLIYTVGIVFVAAMSKVVLAERGSRAQTEKLLTELELSHRQLQDYAGQVAELATTRERNRLARDIHDSLGHYLTVVNVQLEKALAFRQKNPVEADESVLQAKRLASDALREVRRSVGALRDEEKEFSLVRSLEQLAANVRSEQLAVDVRFDGAETGFPKQTLITLYRAAQEGLTNIQKHASARRVELHVALNESDASLTVQDDGKGFDLGELYSNRAGGHLDQGSKPEQGNLPPEKSYGLRGLQERLEQIGGSLRLQSSLNAGTRLFVSIPKARS